MSFSELAKEGYEGFEWSGVRDAAAFDHIAAMQPGELAFFYHTGQENRFYGIVQLLSAAKSDSTDNSGQWLSVDVAVFLRLISRVPLEMVRLRCELQAFARRVETGPDIQPVSPEEWTAICQLGALPRIPQSG